MFWGADIGIDLGTATVLIYMRGRGIVLQEPSVVAIERDSGQLLAVGEEARRMLGRTPGNIVAIRPLRDGVIADYDVTERMLKYFITKVCGQHLFFRPRIMVCIPAVVTTVEKRAVLEAAMQAGARRTYLIEEPLAAALGAGLEIAEPSGSMVVDIGGGTTDVAVLSLGGIVLGESLRVAGDKFDDAIVRYVRRVYNMMIGERSAEELKINIGTAFPAGRKESMDVRGRDLVTGLPKTIRITSEETLEALMEPVQAIVQCVKSVLEKTPPELAADIVDKGVVLTGGGALLHGLDKLLAQETEMPVYVSENAVTAVALGTGRALEYLDKLRSKNTFVSELLLKK
ncbi:MAG TPA: rod shape-determining protein [Firmicutes bacterium]|jgi:rod shape-determining protein MreB|uniref:rod shape-determining protein n=1 Tax=Gelria sp. Kuro-4 TaxID=2796927 RepID=UPI0019CAFD21|nr:rod shape-determining protein [Gelria sp. Kuro-4]MDK2926882.1 rod shape-determining protein MreB [Bacillota bacterium]BCV24127.1 rod shape-determining protein [Gelria sp. Kuro-4]HHV57672.1 rod shape-determining protein [Bacillota bacterium]